MFLKTKAIILHCLKYSDKANIVHLISEERGRLACIVYGASRKKSGSKMAFLQPLTLVDLEIEMLPDRELHQIKEARPYNIITSIQMNPVKNALALFLAEFLYRTLRDSQTDKMLFRFLQESVQILERSEQGVANFHLVMMLHLTRFLGFFPSTENLGLHFYFDMVNGVFTSTCPLHKHFLRPAESAVLYQLMRINYTNMHMFRFSRGERVAILEYMLSYYRIHLSEIGEIKSLPVLMELFD
ncbi:DNA repair protein RecO [Paludibacter sp.]|uniref:DNA repair protein RecO n=1 Tax=Paludibacter sp. TaxID=1898105 RepID=UPI00135394BF|nr:DNA repair protein RecO [Paludibacter sp.]MTK53142.1 DNA repair protein RecO [Paludibacter sp.]